ncbi:beta-galactosidase precursor, putative [Ixodes scapularis]|uniref:Beta-galactosidase n=1 Tax=Ixodes scapularis TaxID=6945 RepID=B7PW84_IXOSC|nr:beta-galactosidase precursor, putative [Ixodes scapularis]|eukprot:XP_002409402.1 beta-galactosidase precursor, putative [Ixodes scapularis]
MSALWIFFALRSIVAMGNTEGTARSFIVDYEHDRFLKDGEPFRYVSGSLHYFRVPKPYWKDRMTKMKLAGLNALQTYVEWSGHEPEPGKYVFEDNYDLKTFLETAQEVGLLVIFRPGPYICAERDNGGLPYWLLRLNPNMRYRSSDKTYLDAVDHWLNVLLPTVEPYLYKNGGPIITVQVENEYGQYFVCDHNYMRHLVEVFQHYLGRDIILFRTDAPSDSAYRCDAVNNTLVTADFGADTNIKRAFDVVKRAEGKGPLIVTEYYPGWLDHWGAPHVKIDSQKMLETFEEILQYNASVNFYMFHGGTNFGFSNGKNPPPQPTSYDYGAPLSEAGDPTDVYYKIRNITSKYLPLPPGKPPAPAPKLNLGTVEFTASSSLQEMLNFFRQYAYLTNATSLYPITFEELGQDFGYVAYTTTIEFQPKSPTALAVPGISDRGYVYTRATRAVLSNDHLTYSVPVVVQKGENLTIIVENTGRINFGPGNKDFKGIVSNVTLGGHLLTNWTMEGVPLSTPEQLSLLSKFLMTLNGEPKFEVPGIFFGYFMLPRGQEPLDTFLDPTGFGKGVAILNGFNLGRYWPSIGPQVTLYVPGTLLLPYPQVNLVALFEMESAPEGPKTVKFVDVPNIDGPTPT